MAEEGVLWRELLSLVPGVYRAGVDLGIRGGGVWVGRLWDTHTSGLMGGTYHLGCPTAKGTLLRREDLREMAR